MADDALAGHFSTSEKFLASLVAHADEQIGAIR